MKMQEKSSLAAYISSGFLVAMGKIGAFFNDLTLNEWAIVIGIVMATVTCIVNIYFQRRQTRAIEKASLSGTIIIGRVK